MEIMKWKERITKASSKKFPQGWSPQDKLLSLISQVADIGEEVQFRQGVRKTTHRKDHDIKQQIIGALIDIFVLCDMFDVNIDKELHNAEKWFLHNKEVR